MTVSPPSRTLAEKSRDPSPVVALQECRFCMFGIDRHHKPAYRNLFNVKDTESKKIIRDP